MARFTSALFAFALFAAAVAVPTPQDVEYVQCNGGQVQCCNDVKETNQLDAPYNQLLSVFDVDVKQLTGKVGLTCNTVNVLGIGSNSCDAQTVCCTDNSFDGIIALGCTPININL
ncbi:hypothetical protein CC1G_06082 [Coprinopsis cinerea okayama7|uniref:Hydrophobin n=1 Tax=Coprinopsis cinerea (strain Okayama-7 / 130 / ATCC MYA-4618 / FGSC 9003) TaxID=240176 RepID=A8PA33_COPC7|nr:hypothetical protein CC1G_06082 [Coprinopsis cinerea okayama7\|eukprot:XP_001839892.2 hypothetical protein CC1G_06082 [Coprinopsis cinerea okayama7\